MTKKIELEEQVKVEKEEENNKAKWEKPTLEDVSGKIMAQPYIRFT